MPHSHAASGDPLSHLVCASTAASDFAKGAVLEMAQEAANAAQAYGVTGMFLYANRSFFQVFEGPKSAVEILFETLSQDLRHTSLTKVLENPVSRRSFADWSTAIAFYEGDQLEEIPGCNDFFSTGDCLRSLPSSPTKELLEAFKGGFWRAPAATLPGAPAQDEADIGPDLIRDARSMIDRSDLND